ncbi:MAG: TonB-dependent receptor [Bacteroidia bacterium]
MRILLPLLLLFSTIALAQQPALPENKGRVAGKVTDATTKTAVEFATIKIIDATTSKLVDGATTNEQGFFNIVINYGKYVVNVDFIGFDKYTSDTVIIDNTNRELVLKNVALSTKSKNLQAVEITAQKEVVENKIDRKIYNVAKDLNAASGSAENVLQNVPSVTFDSDGNINLRGGANVTILINGKPTSLGGADKQALLSQIQASSIEQIEVITNPSARFDADGTNGIINIVLKKNQKPGHFGTVAFGAGSRQELKSFTVNKYVTTASYNYRNKWLALGTTLNYNNKPVFAYGDLNRTTQTTDSTQLKMLQYNSSERNIAVTSGRVTADITLSPTNQLFVSGSGMYHTNTAEELINYNFSNKNDVLLSSYNRYNTSNMLMKNWNTAAQYRHDIKENKSFFTIDASYDNLKNNNASQYITLLAPTGTVTQLSTIMYTNLIQAQADYSNKFSDKVKLETGVKYTTRNAATALDASNNVSATGYIYDTLISSALNYTDANYAGYANASGAMLGLNYMAGVRYENVQVNLTVPKNNGKFSYSIANFFPSLFLNKVVKKSTVGISYSRRIRRPSAEQLNPFPEYDDPTSLRVGNPLLKPEFINSFEATFNTTYNAWSYSLVGYYRLLQNPFNRLISANNNGVIYVTLANIDATYNTGIDASLRLTFIPKTTISINSNTYYAQVKSTVEGNAFSKQGVVSNNKFSVSYSASKVLQFQLNANLNTPMFNAQGIIQPANIMGISAKYDFWKQRANLTLNYSDITNTQYFKIKVVGTNFETTNYRKRESRILFATLTIKLGKDDNTKRKRMVTRDEQQGGGGGDGF